MTDHGLHVPKFDSIPKLSSIDIPIVCQELPQEELINTLRRLDERWLEKIRLIVEQCEVDYTFPVTLKMKLKKPADFIESEIVIDKLEDSQ